jgi:thiamine-monophosphate kinase
MATGPGQVPGPPPALLTEAGIIAALTPALPGRPDVRLGIGDDGAVLRPSPGTELVVVTDALVEGTHFPAGMPARAIGHRALAVNLSDLAAMGATPRWATLALSLPAPQAAWLEDFAAGLLGLAAATGTALVGGDTVAGPLFTTVTAIGEVPAGQPAGRRGARPGDAVFVTGTPGDAVQGRLLLGSDRDDAAAQYLRSRFLYPDARLAAGRALRPLASAMLDVSDGLDQDLGRLAAASGVGLELDAGLLPLSPQLRTVAGPDAIARALTGGDDYELAFTAPAVQAAAIAAIAAAAACAITRIGTVVAGSAVRWHDGGREYPVPAGAWQHFGAGA